MSPVEIADRRPILYTDLDDTLFQTSRKMSEPPCETRLAAMATNGHHSYMSLSQARMTDWFLRTTCMIPVTARSTEALSRCRIPFESWRIAANGAVILDAQGIPDPYWAAHIAAISRDFMVRLKSLNTVLSNRNCDGRFRHWIVTESGWPIYFCAKSNGAECWLEDALDLLRPVAKDDFVEHRNGNNVSLTPIGIAKRRAVLHLDERIGGESLRFGMGDSLTDLPFMGACDMMIIPPRSQLETAIGRG